MGKAASIDWRKVEQGQKADRAQAQARVSLATRTLQDISAWDLNLAGQEYTSSLRQEIEQMLKKLERVYW